MKLRRKGSLAVGALVVCLLAAYADTDDPGRSPVMIPEIDLLLSLHQQSLYGYHENAGAGDKTRCDDKCSKGWIAFRAGPGDEPSGHFSLMACREDPGQWIFEGHPMCVAASKRGTFSMETVGLDGKSRDLPNAHVPGVRLQVLSRTTFMYPVSWNGLLPGPCVGRSFRAMQTSI